jgi:hypothetical protein
LEREEFDRKAEELYADLLKAIMPVLEKHKSCYASLLGVAIAGIIKMIADSFPPIRNEFLRVMINDLHDYRLKENTNDER